MDDTEKKAESNYGDVEVVESPHSWLLSAPTAVLVTLRGRYFRGTVSSFAID